MRCGICFVNQIFYCLGIGGNNFSDEIFFRVLLINVSEYNHEFSTFGDYSTCLMDVSYSSWPFQKN